MTLVSSGRTRLAIATALCTGALLGACDTTQADKASPTSTTSTSQPTTLGWRTTSSQSAAAPVCSPATSQAS